MKIDSFCCDICSTQKGSNNHWFRFTGHDDQFSVTDWAGSDYTNTIHLCSDECVIKAVQKWLSAQKQASQKKVIEEQHEEHDRQVDNAKR